MNITRPSLSKKETVTFMKEPGNVLNSLTLITVSLHLPICKVNPQVMNICTSHVDGKATTETVPHQPRLSMALINE